MQQERQDAAGRRSWLGTGWARRFYGFLLSHYSKKERRRVSRLQRNTKSESVTRYASSSQHIRYEADHSEKMSYASSTCHTSRRDASRPHVVRAAYPEKDSAREQNRRQCYANHCYAAVRSAALFGDVLRRSCAKSAPQPMSQLIMELRRTRLALLLQYTAAAESSSERECTAYQRALYKNNRRHC